MHSYEKIENIIRETIKGEFEKYFKHTNVQSISEVYTIDHVSGTYEKSARKIWVATMTLDLDVNDSSIINAVKNNYSQGKEYKYFIPDNYECRANEEMYNKIYNNYMDQFEIIYIPEESINLFEEIVIYDYDTIKKVGFTLVTTETDKLYIKLRKDILQKKIDILSSFFQHKGDIMRLCFEYSQRSEIKNNTNCSYILKQLNANPFLTKRKLKEIISKFESNNISKECIADFENSINNFVMG